MTDHETRSRTDAEELSAPSSRRSRLVRGGVLMSLVSIVSRLSSLVAQLFLGRLLLQDEFGLFAMALGITGIGGALRSALLPVLVDHLENDPREFDRTYRVVVASLWSLAAVGIATSPSVGSILGEPDLPPLLAFMILLMPFQILGSFGIARLSHRLEFGSISKVYTVTGLSRHVVVVAAAFAGFGAYSMAGGTAFAAAAEFILLRRHGRFLPETGLLSRQTITDVKESVRRGFSLRGRRWIWLGAIATTAGLYGDYTVASIWLATGIIGIYYFGYQLTGSFFEPVNLAINTVLVPAFVSLKDPRERQQRFQETVTVLSIVGVTVFNSATILIAPLVHVMWNGKWDEAIPVMLVFTLLGPIQVLHTACISIGRGSGLWNFYFGVTVVTGVVTIVGAAIGASLGTLLSLAVAVTVADVLATLGALVVLSRRLEAQMSRVLLAAVMPFALGVPGLLAANAVSPITDPTPDRLLLRTAVFVVVSVLVVGGSYRKLLLSTTRSLLQRSPAVSISPS